ncbi:28S ribosomal protein S9, mitochondrial [Colletes gigas]|uniref:28S ribosomal protein S9, mitochondrial n=1 Tax=Colletes gigas TaxID=935657 RepID=UPI001C9B739A|nr:28S ribosomal protein S9, mitochondrial [Colletes gigas]
MALTKFIRLLNARNVINVNNIREVGDNINTKRLLSITSKSYSTINNEIDYVVEDSFPNTSNKKLSKAMKVYLQQAKDYKEFLKKEAISYDLGKRHLANMMGVELDDLTDTYIEKTIEYLFPSGLYDWRARPMMARPEKLFPNKKEAEFSESGRPYNFLFYTCKPVYYEILYNIADSIKLLNKMEDDKIAKKQLPSAEEKFDPIGSDWLLHKQIESKIMETIKTEQLNAV